MTQQNVKLYHHLSYIPEQFLSYDNPFIWEIIAMSFKYSDEMQTIKELKESVDNTQHL